MEQKHSGLGIASFLISLMAGFGLLATIVAALVVRSVLTRHTHGDEVHVARMVFVVLLLGLILLDLVALGLGIAGLAQAERKKLFAILGTAFAAIPILFGILAVVELA